MRKLQNCTFPGVARFFPLLVFLLLTGCAAPKPDETKTAALSSPEPAYEEIEVTDGGTVSGTVRFAGTPPPLERRQLNEKNPDVCGHGSKPAQDLILGPEGALRNVVVAISDIRKGKKPAAPPAVLDQKHCDYLPHVQAVAVGSTLEIRNSDDLLHNVHGKLDGRATLFNLAMPLKDQVLTRQLTKTGVIALQCDAGHTWMKAYIVVLENPYFATTDSAGRFSITNIPPGSYKLRAWHERLGSIEQDVRIDPGTDTKISYTYQ